jgi:hypothetical protein
MGTVVGAYLFTGDRTGNDAGVMGEGKEMKR